MASDVPVAVISGGSSGIGFEIARILAQRGFEIVLLARRVEMLEAARASILSRYPDHGVEAIALDVADAPACQKTVDAILAQKGRIDWFVASAGIVEPGMFVDLPLKAHRRQMEVNYFGTLNLVLPIAGAMRCAGKGNIVLISSGAAFAGIVGYSGYCPGKFAVRGLGETLRVELEPIGISVSVAYPPDTDTPQYHGEQAEKPEATKRITANGGVMKAQDVAALIVAGADRGQFMLAPSLAMKALGWLHSLYAPLFRWQQGRVLREVAVSHTGMNAPKSTESKP